jgi:Transposase DDE domain
LRWIALRLSQQQREAAERRKRRKACLHQQRMQADTLYLAGWVLVVTTLPREQWTDQQVLCLYRARWHIELVFKRIKQLLGQHRLRCTTAATAQPTLTALLLGWALLEEESSAVRLAMREAMTCIHQAVEEGEQVARTGGSWRDGPLSEWLLAEVSVDLFCQQLRGSYTVARYRMCLPRLQRFLCSGHRKRPHLYSQLSRWLGMPASHVPERAGVS